jgi:hypothetical protein
MTTPPTKRISWETTLTGLGAMLLALGSALQAQFDQDPATIPDWGLVLSLSLAGLGLLRARDNNKTSEQVGANPTAGEQPASRGSF